jgi:hypothetical protein
VSSPRNELSFRGSLVWFCSWRLLAGGFENIYLFPMFCVWCNTFLWYEYADWWMHVQCFIVSTVDACRTPMINASMVFPASQRAILKLSNFTRTMQA